MATDRNYIIDRIKSKSVTPAEFNFDKLQAPPLNMILNPVDINTLHNIATSLRLSGRVDLKLKEIDKVMRSRGFVKFIGGTNRITYRPLESQDYLIKVAYNDVGIGDNPKDYTASNFLFKPFLPKVFECSPCGTVALVERVTPITSREQFYTVAEDVYYLINNILVGEYVFDDIGTEAFMNYGIRDGFGVVLLDSPYYYKLDGKKIFCTAPSLVSPTGTCDGEIDYDPGYNRLICTKCGAKYKGRDLAEAIKEEKIIVRSKGEIKMKISVKGGSKNVNREVNAGKFADLAKTTPKETVESAPKIVVKDQRSSDKLSEAREIVNPTNEGREAVSSDNLSATSSIVNPTNEGREIGTIGGLTVTDVSEDDSDKKEKDVFAVRGKPVSNDNVVDNQLDDIKNIVFSNGPSIVAIKDSPISMDEDLTPIERFNNMLEELCNMLTDFKNPADWMKDEEKEKYTGYYNGAVEALKATFDYINDEVESDPSITDIAKLLSKVDKMMLTCVTNHKDSSLIDIFGNDINEWPGFVKELVKLFSSNESGEADSPCDNKYSDNVAFFAAKIINIKDIFPEAESSRIMVAIDPQGNYLTYGKDKDIVAIDVIDDRSVGKLSIIPSSYFKEINKFYEDCHDNAKEMKDAPTGAFPPVEDKFVNGVEVKAEEEK